MNARALLARIRQTLDSSLARLNPRERRLVSVLGAVTLVGGVYIMIVEPYQESRHRARRRIETLSRDLGAMESLAAKIRALEATPAQVESSEATAAGFSLFSFVDKATQAAISRDAVASMNPAKRPVRGGLEESSVELRLTSVGLPEIVALLEQIEATTEPVYVKRVELKRRYDDRARFDATIVTAALTRT